jgi:UDP-N-acetylglucosamine acyltransferase
MSLIHPTAIVHPNAILGEGTRVGAFSIIEEHVVTGKDCDIQDHVVVRGRTQIGDQVRIFPFAAVGVEPQHMAYKGEPTTVVIGNRVTLRESVTVHRGTTFGTGTTIIGDDAFIMAYCHVAHDCIVGKNTILANLVNLAGHVTIGDYAVVGGMTAVCQYCRVGNYAFVGGGSLIRKDLPPYLVGKGNDFHVQGVNLVGLSRRGFAAPAVKTLKQLYRIFYLQKLTVNQAIEKAQMELGDSDEVRLFISFLKTSKMGIER